MRQLIGKQGKLANTGSEMIASERVLSNVVDSQIVPSWHPMPSALDLNNKESIGATL